MENNILFKEKTNDGSIAIKKDGDDLIWRIELKVNHSDAALYLQTEFAFENNAEFRINDNAELFKKTASFTKMHHDTFWGDKRRSIITQIEHVEEQLLEKGILNEYYECELYDLILCQPYTHYVNGIPEDGICSFCVYNDLNDPSILNLLNCLNINKPLSLFWFDFTLQGFVSGENILQALKTLLSPPKEKDIITYIVKDKLNRYKIGRTSCLDKRITQISTYNPNLKLILTIPGNVEYKLHKEYECKNVGGEWFNLSKNDIINIKKKYII